MIEILLWHRRTECELTLRDLERITGLSRSALNRIENGQVSPTLAQLELLSDALDCTITDLFAVVNPPP